MLIPSRQRGGESLLKYHSGRSGLLTSDHDLVQGQCLVGSLTGAVAS